MNDVELKAENVALRKQNKNLKALLEEALEIIRKLKEIVDHPGSSRPKPRRRTVRKTSQAVKKQAGLRKASSRKAP